MNPNQADDGQGRAGDAQGPAPGLDVAVGAEQGFQHAVPDAHASFLQLLERASEGHARNEQNEHHRDERHQAFALFHDCFSSPR